LNFRHIDSWEKQEAAVGKTSSRRMTQSCVLNQEWLDCKKQKPTFALAFEMA
jgi:hypothetical protein